MKLPITTRKFFSNLQQLTKKEFVPSALWISSFFLCALLSLTGCQTSATSSGQNAPDKNIPVTLNEVAHSVFYAPLYTAMENGYFAEEGLDLTLVTGFGADKTMTAVLTGEADLGFMGSESTIYTYLGNPQDPVINFAQLTQRAGNFLVSRTPMDSFSWNQLKGKTVLGGRAGVVHQSM